MTKMQNTPSIITKFPDAIRCGSGEHSGATFLLHSGRGGNYVWYFQAYASEDRYVRFNLDGTYNFRRGHDLSSKGCEGKSIEQLYAQGRAFNFVNDPEQIQRVKNLEEKNQKWEEATQKQRQKIQELEDKIENILEEMNDLKQTCNDTSKLDSNKCFAIFKTKDIEICIANTKTRVVPAKELKECNHRKFCVSNDSWTINKNDHESNYDACIRNFASKGFVPCGDEEHIF